jgi:hypothetical protein
MCTNIALHDLLLSLACCAGALQVQLLPPTPPASDLNAAGRHLPQHIRRSHSLDSGLNSLTGLLDQLALGQLEEGGSCEYDEYGQESDSWTLLDQLSEEGPNSCCSGNSSKGGAAAAAAAGASVGGSVAGEAAKAAAALLLLGGAAGGSSGHHHYGMQQQQQQHLQPVQEGCEEQDATEVQVFGIGVAAE